ncbi:hypothetical protein [Paraburkholderia hayleyella]|uniref:hypothetical protein n=1 Tax=Paraburkholderia hayleyella TaxID=2152889 RepID=UPI001290F71A|nr:hypothetical protein [Paraburkholderia hayleyella]
MKAAGTDMGDYQESYKAYEIEVAIEQLLTGVKAHFRILKDTALVHDWQLVAIDDLMPTEHAAAEAAFAAGRAWIDSGRVAGVGSSPSNGA